MDDRFKDPICSETPRSYSGQNFRLTKKPSSLSFSSRIYFPYTWNFYLSLQTLRTSNKDRGHTEVRWNPCILWLGWTDSDLDHHLDFCRVTLSVVLDPKPDTNVSNQNLLLHSKTPFVVLYLKTPVVRKILAILCYLWWTSFLYHTPFTR